MSGNLGQEIDRYGAKLGGFFSGLGKKATAGLEELKVGAEAKVKEFREGAEARFGELKKGAEETVAELRKSGDAQLEQFKTVTLPKLKVKADVVLGHVAANADLTGRRLASEAREFLSEPTALEREKSVNFNLITSVVRDGVKMHSGMRKFLGSDQARFSGFDSTDTQLVGIPLYPSAARMKYLKDEFVPVRIYVSATGLKSREYEQTPAEEVIKGAAQYTFKGERDTTAEDLFALSIKAESVQTALEETMSSSAYGIVNGKGKKV